ncbi:MAG TPA: DMT family transporter [Hypericibacter adhaerens]|jgi:drug/metabolite transporter (DMT)-like permease|uniref:DMT family transporter n=1 Tax=Hypericibacter adhaerens TaxID=2602016 RepID=UPI002C2493E5|nr:DMT family transporter [Hypericibacter adhaerens]HWA42700.1 DMT family transporter [Hypericibacter adhaerens]
MKSGALALTVSDRPLLGAAILVGALAMLPGMDAIAKHLSGHLPVLEIVWARYFVYALLLLPAAVRRHGPGLLRPSRPFWQLLRGGLMALSALMFFSAIARVPLADAMAVFFIYPLLILVISALFMGETIGWQRWLLVLFGFIGAILVIRPSIQGVSPGVLFALASGAAYGSALVVTRKLAVHDPGLVTATISALVGAAAYSLIVPFVWVMPAPADWPMMALIGVIATAGHFLIIAAHRMATASQLAPYGYTEIVAAILFGFIVFGDIPDPIVWLGIAVIIASGIAVTWSHRKPA